MDKLLPLLLILKLVYQIFPLSRALETLTKVSFLQPPISTSKKVKPLSFLSSPSSNKRKDPTLSPNSTNPNPVERLERQVVPRNQSLLARNQLRNLEQFTPS
jgi:hypothetical protein